MAESRTTSNRSAWKCWGREVAQVFCGGWVRLQSRLWIAGVACGVGMALVWLTGGQDASLQQVAQVDNAPNVRATAKFLSDYSDLNFAVPLSVLLWITGAAFGKRRLRKLALACLMATLMAGLMVTLIKSITGRARPKHAQEANLRADRFHWFEAHDDYWSFPSGHTITSSATAASLAGAVPVLTVPGVIYAASVGWSRMQLDKHYPIDVATGAVLGTLCGLCFASTVPGSWVKLKRKKAPSSKHQAPEKLQ